MTDDSKLHRCKYPNIQAISTPDINVPLNAVGYNWYGLKHEKFSTEHGQEAVDAYISMIRKFAEFDETILNEAYKALEKHYPKALSQYYDMFIKIRKEVCREFLEEIVADTQARGGKA